MVRFGNVLAPRVPSCRCSRSRSADGGPVTVTHPDVIRYFMTIPEAAQLVIQAGSMGKGGDVFVLDMGSPVRIDDLARRMVNLMGLTVRDGNIPDGDIEIEYTGLRPAEKLFEELLIGNNVTGTEHPMILRAMEHSLSWEQIEQVLNELLVALRLRLPPGARDAREAVAGIPRRVSRSSDHVWTRKADAPASAAPRSPTSRPRDAARRPPSPRTATPSLTLSLTPAFLSAARAALEGGPAYFILPPFPLCHSRT